MEQNNLDVEKEKKDAKKIGKSKTLIIVAVLGVCIFIIALLIIGSVFFLKAIKGPKDNGLSIITEASLKEVLEINELSTVDYTYNAIATKYNDDNSDVLYYVAYEGVVQAGIDFQEISFEINDDEKKIIITLPEISIHEMSVNMGTMDYIFTKKKYETETITQEAYKLCLSDLESRINQEELLKDMAKKNAVSSVKALFRPWVETVNSEYEIEVK